MIERFDYDKHAPLLAGWQRARGFGGDIGGRELYPRFGLIVDGCVVGFLYRTDAPRAGYLDGVIADPYADADRRAKAIDVLCEELVREADAAGIVLLWAQTAHPSLVGVCKRNGFLQFGTGYACLVRKRKE